MKEFKVKQHKFRVDDSVHGLIEISLLFYSEVTTKEAVKTFKRILKKGCEDKYVK